MSKDRRKQDPLGMGYLPGPMGDLDPLEAPVERRRTEPLDPPAPAPSDYDLPDEEDAEAVEWTRPRSEKSADEDPRALARRLAEEAKARASQITDLPPAPIGRDGPQGAQDAPAEDAPAKPPKAVQEPKAAEASQSDSSTRAKRSLAERARRPVTAAEALKRASEQEAKDAAKATEKAEMGTEKAEKGTKKAEKAAKAPSKAEKSAQKAAERPDKLAKGAAKAAEAEGAASQGTPEPATPPKGGKRTLAERARRPMSAAEALKRAAEEEARQKAEHEARKKAEREASMSATAAVLAALSPALELLEETPITDRKVFKALWQAHRVRALEAGDLVLAATASTLLDAAERLPPDAMVAARVSLGDEGYAVWVDRARGVVLGAARPPEVFLVGAKP